MLKALITFASELAVGQILRLSGSNKIYYFSRLYRRVAGKGWKALYAKLLNWHENTDFNVCVMCLTAKGRFKYIDFSYLSVY